MSEDKLQKPAQPAHAISAREAWRVFGIMSEFVEATERLANVRPAATVFAYYERRGFEPSPQEREVLLNL
ncbi:MAG: hypothetical protein WD886_11190 [Burkholderiales bacterium]